MLLKYIYIYINKYITSYRTIFFCIQMVTSPRMNLDLLQLRQVLLDLKSQKIPNAKSIISNYYFRILHTCVSIR